MTAPALLNNDSEIKSEEDLKENRNICKVIKVEVKRVKIENDFIQMFMVTDLSAIYKNQKSKMKKNFTQQLTASLCHEVMTPLNCIINITDILLFMALSNKEDKQKIEFI